MDTNTGLTTIDDAGKLTHYSEAEYGEAIDRIMLHGQSGVKFRSILSSANNATLTGNYSNSRISHHYFDDCKFEGATLHRITGAGSIFSAVKFSNTILSRANFQSSTFERCEFDQCQLDGSNFSENYFADSVWTDCSAEAFNMSGSYFKGCRFIRTRPGNLAEACLDNVYFEDVRLANMNMEFSDFKTVQMNRAILAFSQMPYVFNGLQYLTHTSDDVSISSHINDKGCITVGEYMNVLKDMEVFYSYRGEYFPLSNILLAFGRYEEAIAAILQGAASAAIQGDFRMCKYFCKLLTDEKYFNAKTLEEFYKRLCKVVQMHTFSDAEHFQYTKYFPEIRAMLVENPSGYPHAALILKSKIEIHDSDQIIFMLNTLDELIHIGGLMLNKPGILLMHNSPTVFLVDLCGNPMSILAAAYLILSAFSSVCKSFNEAAKLVLNVQEMGKNHRNAALHQLERQKLSKEIEKLEMENTELREKLTARRKAVQKSGIILSEAELDVQDFDPTRLL